MSCLAFNRSAWDGFCRPSPQDLRGPAFDFDEPQVSIKKILVCAAPRTSSKHLARLLFGAGLGVPLEYFNENTFKVLLRRWSVDKKNYLVELNRRRCVNGVFASNLQFGQIKAWNRAGDVEALFADATVVHLVREDKIAQAASLAAALLTGRWGFEISEEDPNFSAWRLKHAARKAMDMVAADDELWREWFEQHGIHAEQVSSEFVNQNDNVSALLQKMSVDMGVCIDGESLKKMLEIDGSRYQGDAALKCRLKEMIIKEWS